MYCILYFGELEESTNYMQVFQDFSWEYFTWKLIVLLGFYHWFIQLTWSLPIYHGFAYRRETILFTWKKMGPFETSRRAFGTHTQLCSLAAFWAGIGFVLQEKSRSCWWNTMRPSRSASQGFSLAFLSKNLGMAFKIKCRGGTNDPSIDVIILRFTESVCFQVILPQKSLCRFIILISQVSVYPVFPPFVLFFLKNSIHECTSFFFFLNLIGPTVSQRC